LQTFALKAFVKVLFEQCSVLQPYKGQLEEIYSKFSQYKSQVPTMGAVLLDEHMQHCLLVRGVRKQATWGFPKGKVDQGESDSKCAVREVFEETSFDIGPHLKEQDHIEVTYQNQRRKVYIIRNIDRNTPFAPRAPGEIGNYAWMPISELPATKNEESAGLFTGDGTRHKCWAIWPFIKPLKAWIKKQGKQKKRSASVNANAGILNEIEPSESCTLDDANHPWLDFTFDKQAVFNAAVSI